MGQIEQLTEEEFKAEYQVIKAMLARTKKVMAMYVADKIDDDDLKTPIDVYIDQKQMLQDYLDLLEIRAEYEGITL